MKKSYICAVKHKLGVWSIEKFISNPFTTYHNPKSIITGFGEWSEVEDMKLLEVRKI